MMLSRVRASGGSPVQNKSELVKDDFGRLFFMCKMEKFFKNDRNLVVDIYIYILELYEKI